MAEEKKGKTTPKYKLDQFVATADGQLRLITGVMHRADGVGYELKDGKVIKEADVQGAYRKIEPRKPRGPRKPKTDAVPQAAGTVAAPKRVA